MEAITLYQWKQLHKTHELVKGDYLGEPSITCKTCGKTIFGDI